jgi:hypothetical protein
MESHVSAQEHRVRRMARPGRRWLAGAGVLVLLALALTGLLWVTRPVAAQGPTYVSGPIAGPTTWTAANSPYIVTGTVTILDTGSLTVEAGVEVRFQWATGLVAEGPLTAIGGPTAPVTFTTDLEPPEPLAWNGISLVGSNNTLQHCLVERGYYALDIAPTSHHNLVADCQLSQNGYWDGPVGGTILGSTDHSQFLRNLIFGSPFGILLLESSHNVIHGNEIGFLDEVGVGLQGTPGSYGTGNVVTGNFFGRLRGEGASFLYQSGLTVAGNYLYQAANGSSPGPLMVVPSPAPTPVYTPVQLPIAAGMSLRSCDGVTVTGNTVTESGWGDEPTYRAGVYISNTTGLVFDGNAIHLNMDDGLEYAAVNGGAPFMHNNGFWDNEDLDLESFYPASLDVTGNWWGTDQPTPGVHLSGTLAYTPWVTLSLTASPTLLPANGLAQAELTVTMLDGTGYHAPDGLTVDLAASLGWLYPTRVSLASGTGVSHLTAPTEPGTAWLTATAPLPPPGMTTTIPSGRQAFAWVTFALSEPETLNLDAYPAIIPADGVSTSTLRAEVLSQLGAPVDDGTVVVFSTTLGTFPGGLDVTPKPAGVMTVEAESDAVSKIGSWQPYSDTQASGGGGVFSNWTDDRVTYTFTGTAVSAIVQKQDDAGIANVYLDGLLVEEIDTYHPDTLYQQEEFIAGGLTFAPHLIEVEVTSRKNISSTNTYIWVDAFRVYGHDRNGAYLTSEGVSTVTLTSVITPGFAQVTACADPACDTTLVQFRQPGLVLLYLPLVNRSQGQPPPPVCQELLVNGGFEDSTAWVVGDTPRPARYTTEQAHSGARSVLLGLKPGESDLHSYSSVRQAITLPPDIDSATLSFWYYPLSELDSGDRQECLLLDQHDQLLAILMRTNVNSAAWTERSYDLSAYAGQTIKVYFNAYNDGDGSGVTGFYLDDVSVQACTPPPP